MAAVEVYAARRAVLRALGRANGEWVTRTSLRYAISWRCTPYLDEAVASLKEHVEIRESIYKGRKVRYYRLVADKERELE